MLKITLHNGYKWARLIAYLSVFGAVSTIGFTAPNFVLSDTTQAEVNPNPDSNTLVLSLDGKDDKKIEAVKKILQEENFVNFTEPEAINQELRELKKNRLVLIAQSDKNLSNEQFKGALSKLKQADAVLTANRNNKYQIALEPNDPYWTNGGLWGLKKIGMQQAWDQTTGSNDIIVADTDTGVNYNHEDLADNMWKNAAEIPGDKIDNDGNGYVDDIYGIDTKNKDSDPMDDHGHGTHTAGTLGAVGNNNKGVVGVNWNVKILVCKFIGADGWGDDADAIKCFNYIVLMKNRGVNIRVTTNSWGDPVNPAAPFPQALKDSIDAVGSAGIVNVFAAGNAGVDIDKNPFYPASFASNTTGSTTAVSTSILAVAASASTDGWPSWSNYGLKSVHLAAPGVSILSTGGGALYNYLSGTSMATPHVAGAAAALLAKKPTLTVGQLKSQILDNVDALPQWQNKVISGGRLNVFKALSAESNPAPPIKKPDLNVQSLAVAPSLTTPGATLTATVLIKNDGDADAAAFSVDFYQNRLTPPPDGLTGDKTWLVSQLAAGATTSLTHTFSTAQTGVFKAWAQVDTKGQIDETKENNNNLGPINYEIAKPDAAVTSLTVTPSHSLVGTQLTASITVKNSGKTNIAKPFAVDFYQNRASAPGAAVAGDKRWTIDGLATGEQKVITYPFVATSPGAYKAWAQVDTDQQVDEQSETNNVIGPIAYEATQPDLAIKSLAIEPAAAEVGAKITAKIEVENQGGADAGNFLIDFYQNRLTAPTAGLSGDQKTTIALVKAGKSETIKFDFTFSAAADYQAWAQVDTDNKISEISETNNLAGPTNYAVSEKPKPNLIIQAFTVSPNKAEQGAPLVATVVVKNNGSAGASAFSTDFYKHRSDNDKPKKGHKGDDKKSAGPLAAGQTATQTFTFTPAVGSYTAYVQVDEEGGVQATDAVAGPASYTITAKSLPPAAQPPPEPTAPTNPISPTAAKPQANQENQEHNNPQQRTSAEQTALEVNDISVNDISFSGANVAINLTKPAQAAVIYSRSTNWLRWEKLVEKYSQLAQDQPKRAKRYNGLANSYRQQIARTTTTVNVDEQSAEHRISLSKLNANTRYFYRTTVSVGEDETITTEVSNFRTAKVPRRSKK